MESYSTLFQLEVCSTDSVSGKSTKKKDSLICNNLSEVEFKGTHTFAPKTLSKVRSQSKKHIEINKKSSTKMSRSSSSYSEIGMKYLKHRKSNQKLSVVMTSI